MIVHQCQAAIGRALNSALYLSMLLIVIISMHQVSFNQNRVLGAEESLVASNNSNHHSHTHHTSNRRTRPSPYVFLNSYTSGASGGQRVNHRRHHHSHHQSQQLQRPQTGQQVESSSMAPAAVVERETADGAQRRPESRGRDNSLTRLRTRDVYTALDDSKLEANRSNKNAGANIPRPYQNGQTTQVLNQCCACDEAKYELVFEGLWSRYTHPDDFPENYWLAHFSDIIGASHSNDFRMWNPDSFATEGVRELAETGSTKKLESELKQVSSKTRTIIKARELRYPTLNSKTSAVFRTDRQHHLVSILSKLGPSPDWMVGVSGLELCQPDCSWTSQRVVNLYLWDAGTDSGTTFTAPDSPTRPQEKVHPFRKVLLVGSSTQRPISADFSYESPNYQRRSSAQQQYQQQNFAAEMSNGSGGGGDSIGGGGSVAPPYSTSTPNAEQQQQTKPFARLTITRQRIYEKSCNGAAGDASVVAPASRQPTTTSYPSLATIDTWPDMRPTYYDCRYTDWSDWSTCSSTCGKGIRTRTRSFVDEQAHLAGCSQNDLIEKEICLSECVKGTTCVTHDWKEWSPCSVNCGTGSRKRTRSFIGPMKRACESVDLVEVETCTGPYSGNTCPNDPSPCEVSPWSQWSECSVACGTGTRIRTRQYLKKESSENCSARLIQKQSCTGKSESCEENTDKGPTNPNLPVIDCKLSPWTPWSTCSALCGSGKRTRSRYIIQMAQNGGKPCDKKLSRTQRCKGLPPCPPTDIQQNAPPSSSHSSTRHSGNKGTNSRGQQHGSGASSKGNQHDGWRTLTTSTTTQGSSMMDDEDDSKFSRLLQSEPGIVQPASFTSNVSVIGDGTSSLSRDEMKLIDDKQRRQDNHPCEYGNWSQWSDCEIVCQPVKKGSIKIRQRVPVAGQGEDCKIVEELYYCDPNVYC